MNVANNLIKRIIQEQPETTVISYERKSDIQSLHLKLNKLLISKKLFSLIREKDESVLYIPFPAKEWATALRLFILSRVCKKRLTVVLTMLCKCGPIGRMLFKLSGAKVVTLSCDAERIYNEMVGENRVNYLKCGVDTSRFHPIDDAKKLELKQKYGIDTQKPIILHVGHLKRGRNVAELMKFTDRYQVILVASPFTREQQDKELRAELLESGNIRIIDEYLPNIEEIYQLCDVYFFPVVDNGNCIDIPLSCMEAAACNKPLVTTSYGEMTSFMGKDGFEFIDSFSADCLNQAVESVLEIKSLNTRDSVLEYDWNNAVSYFQSIQ